MTKLIRTWSTWIDTYLWFIPEHDLKSYFDEHYSLGALGTLFSQKNVDGFVAKVNGRLAAYEKNKYSEQEHRYYVSSLYLLPQYQGMGLGNELLLSRLHSNRGAFPRSFSTYSFRGRRIKTVRLLSGHIIHCT